MRISCPSCRYEIPDENVSVQNDVAQCGNCNKIYNYSGLLNQSREDSGYSYGNYKQRPPVPMPEKFTRDIVSEGMEITRKWFSPLALLLIPMTLFWNGFMVVWFSIAISQGEMFMAAAGSLHALVGIILAYITLAKLLNNTTIMVTSTDMRIRHRPLPWVGIKSLDRNSVRQFYAKMVTRRSRHGVSYTYDLRVINSEGRDKAVLKGLTTAEQALFLEQEIERHWGIRDDFVAGEIDVQRGFSG